MVSKRTAALIRATGLALLVFVCGCSSRTSSYVLDYGSCRIVWNEETRAQRDRQSGNAPRAGVSLEIVQYPREVSASAVKAAHISVAVEVRNETPSKIWWCHWVKTPYGLRILVRDKSGQDIGDALLVNWARPKCGDFSVLEPGAKFVVTVGLPTEKEWLLKVGQNVELRAVYQDLSYLYPPAGSDAPIPVDGAIQSRPVRVSVVP